MVPFSHPLGLFTSAALAFVLLIKLSTAELQHHECFLSATFTDRKTAMIFVPMEANATSWVAIDSRGLEGFMPHQIYYDAEQQKWCITTHDDNCYYTIKPDGDNYTGEEVCLNDVSTILHNTSSVGQLVRVPYPIFTACPPQMGDPVVDENDKFEWTPTTPPQNLMDCLDDAQHTFDERRWSELKAVLHDDHNPTHCTEIRNTNPSSAILNHFDQYCNYKCLPMTGRPITSQLPELVTQLGEMDAFENCYNAVTYMYPTAMGTYIAEGINCYALHSVEGFLASLDSPDDQFCFNPKYRLPITTTTPTPSSTPTPSTTPTPSSTPTTSTDTSSPSSTTSITTIPTISPPSDSKTSTLMTVNTIMTATSVAIGFASVFIAL